MNRLPKHIKFDDRFDTDWKFYWARQIFFALGNPAFLADFNQWMKIAQNHYRFFDDDIVYKKFTHLTPDMKDSSDRFVFESYSYLNSIAVALDNNAQGNHFADWRDGLQPFALQAINTVYVVTMDDIPLIKKAFESLITMFYMLQYIETATFEPQNLPKKKEIRDKKGNVIRKEIVFD